MKKYNLYRLVLGTLFFLAMAIPEGKTQFFYLGLNGGANYAWFEAPKLSNVISASGYPHDRDTIAFLSEWVRENKDLPPCARHSWTTAQRIKASFI